MQTEFHIASEELYSNSNKVVSINFIEWWLLKYSDLYRPFRNRLPPLPDGSDKYGEDAFRNIYCFLEDLTAYHRYQGICKTAFEELQSIDATTFDRSNQKLLDWVIKYETLGAQDLVGFRLQYWGIEYEQQDGHLTHANIPFSVERNDFQSVIIFCDTFSDIYWNNYDMIAEIFPLSIAAKTLLELSVQQNRQ